MPELRFGHLCAGRFWLWPLCLSQIDSMSGGLVAMLRQCLVQSGTLLGRPLSVSPILPASFLPFWVPGLPLREALQAVSAASVAGRICRGAEWGITWERGKQATGQTVGLGGPFALGSKRDLNRPLQEKLRAWIFRTPWWISHGQAIQMIVWALCPR